jgi:hypothetical protein
LRFDDSVGVCCPSLPEVLADPGATSLLGASTVLAHGPGPDWFENCLSTILAD